MFESLRARRRLRALGRELRERHPPPERAWEGDYGVRHGSLLDWAWASPEFERLLAEEAPLPDGYGVGLDERVLEFPWLYAQRPFGRLLDAGSTLNHDHIAARFQPETSWLAIATLAPEEAAYTERGISYVYADLRELPFRDEWFDTVICASTLEHVGMDNRRYGSDEQVAADPAGEQAAALAELLRVTRRGGRVLITLPYGRSEDHGWFRQYDEAALTGLLGDLDAKLSIYSYGPGGWRLDSLAGARDAEFKDHHADPTPAPDRAAAARAIACVRLTRAGGAAP
jgi:SAM-dependent methyltransferase